MENIIETKLSSKGQVVIPKSLRKSLDWSSGQSPYRIFAIANRTLVGHERACPHAQRRKISIRQDGACGYPFWPWSLPYLFYLAESTHPTIPAHPVKAQFHRGKLVNDKALFNYPGFFVEKLQFAP